MNPVKEAAHNLVLMRFMLLQVLGDHDDEEDDDNDSDNYDFLLLGRWGYRQSLFCLFSETCFEGTVWEGSLGVSLFLFLVVAGFKYVSFLGAMVSVWAQFGKVLWVFHSFFFGCCWFKYVSFLGAIVSVWAPSVFRRFDAHILVF